MLEIAGEPFIAHQLRLLKNKGIEHVVICLGFLGDSIKKYVKTGAQFGLQVEYSFDGDIALGTGGALKKALPLLDEFFFVLYGDSYLQCNYQEIGDFFMKHHKQGLMTVFKNENQWCNSNVIFKNHEILNYDKKNNLSSMQYIDYGLGILSKVIFDHYPAHANIDLENIYQDLLHKKQLLGFEVFERFYEIVFAFRFRRVEENNIMTYTQDYLVEAKKIIDHLDTTVIENMAKMLVELRASHGRLFFLGVGGSAANCSHAVNDFRKIAGIESYTPSDNVAELTARTNDDGWQSVFVEWLKISRLKSSDAVFVLSVGGGNPTKNISVNLVLALEYAQKVHAKIFGIIGRDGGYTAKVANLCCLIPTVNEHTITPHVEAFQAIIWHLLVTHPLLQSNQSNPEPNNKTHLIFLQCIFLIFLKEPSHVDGIKAVPSRKTMQR